MVALGDGAGVVLLGPGEPSALRSCVLHNDPAGFERANYVRILLSWCV